MPNGEEEKTPTSSIVMRAIDATTFSELQAFTKDLESRPTERLLRDVADLVKPSESKAQIVSYVIATKYRHAARDDRQKILDTLEGTIENLEAGEQRDRVSFILSRLRKET
jgi:hypothetical protein